MLSIIWFMLIIPPKRVIFPAVSLSKQKMSVTSHVPQRPNGVKRLFVYLSYVKFTPVVSS